MRKNKVSILLSILFVFFAASVSFSQNTPAAEDRAADAADSQIPAVQGVDADRNFEYSATKAAMYDDGITLFANALVKYELTATDNALADKSYYDVILENAAGSETEYTVPFELHEEGASVIEYYSVDKMGNRELKKQYSVTVDNTAPAAKLKSDRAIYKADGKYYVSGSQLFSITAEDALSGVGTIEYSTDGATYQEYVKAFSVPAADEATIKVRSWDNVLNSTEHFFFVNETADGEEEIAGEDLVLTVDNEAPAVVITPDKEIVEQRDGRGIVLEDYRYEITASDEGSGLAKIFYRLDKAEAWEPYEKPVELSIYGEHRIEAMAVDNVGNASAPVTLLVFVDLVPPAAETTAE